MVKLTNAALSMSRPATSKKLHPMPFLRRARRMVPRPRACRHGQPANPWTGSCPCQPLSSAGQRKGHADERHL